MYEHGLWYLLGFYSGAGFVSFQVSYYNFTIICLFQMPEKLNYFLFVLNRENGWHAIFSLCI